MRIDGYKRSLITAFIIVWLWAAFKPYYRDDWLLENYLVFVFVPIILVSGRYFRLSNLSYTLITVFLMLHVIGSHYTYAHTPFGFALQEWLGAARNMYDRFVHFGFGLFLAYPAREVFIRVAETKGFWSYLLPFDIVLSASAIYEIIEWLVAGNVDPQAGLAFLGAQGDIWDAQKDILAAMTGTLVTLSIVALINWRYDPGFAQEIKQSLKIPQDDEPMGEVKLRRLVANFKRRKP